MYSWRIISHLQSALLREDWDSLVDSFVEIKGKNLRDEERGTLKRVE